MSEEVEMDFVDTVEADLCGVERNLEDVGKRICSVKGGATAHGYINAAISELREAIRNCYKMRDYESEDEDE